MLHGWGNNWKINSLDCAIHNPNSFAYIITWLLLTTPSQLNQLNGEGVRSDYMNTMKGADLYGLTVLLCVPTDDNTVHLFLPWPLYALN